MSVSVKAALLALADQLPDDLVSAERIMLAQVNPRHYVARVEFGEEDEFDGYEVRLQEESDSEG